MLLDIYLKLCYFLFSSGTSTSGSLVQHFKDYGNTVLENVSKKRLKTGVTKAFFSEYEGVPQCSFAKFLGKIVPSTKLDVQDY